MANVVYFNDGVKLPCCPTLLESLYLSASGTCAGDCNANYTGFVAGDLSYNIVYTLPTASGTSGQVLTTDGNNNLSWTTVSGGGGGGTPAGIDGYIQYNNGGSFGGASILYWNDLNSRLGVGTATPNQTLEVAGTMRLTGSTGTPVSILGRDANGDISNVALGSNFLLSGGTLSLSGVTVSGYVPYTGATQNLNLGSFSLASSGVTTPYLQISTAGSSTPMQEGMLRWNNTDRTYEFMMGGGNVLQQIGQELPVPVKHADNAGLQNGKVVYYVSSDGTNKLVRYAIASGESESAGVFGLMTESANGGSKALCTTFGYVRDINTSTLEEGKIVWLSDTELGGMTTTRPTQPSHGVQVGFCIRQHATEGAIFVSIQNGYELDELHNVLISSGITNQEMLFYNSALKVWENKTAAAANLVSGSGTATQVAFWKSGSTNEIEGSPNLYWDNVNTRLGVGTSTPQRALQVQGSILLGVNAEALQGISTGGSTVNLMRIDNSNNLAYGTQFNTTNTIFYTNTGFQFWTYPSGVLTEQFKILQNGNTGINVGTPTARLQVHGTDTSDSGWTAQFHNSLGNSNSLMIRNDGNVGIGTTGTTARLVVRGSGTTSAAAALLVQNSGGSQLLLVDNSGRLQFGSESVRLMSTGNGSSVGITGRGLLLDSLIGSATNIGEFTITGSISPSSGDTYTFRGRSTFIPTSGAATYFGLWVTTTINQTGGASGTTRGLFVDPVLTSAFDWRSIEWSNNTGWGLYGSGTANNYLAGNLSVGTTGTTARLVVRASGSSSASTAMLVENSGGTSLIRVFEDGRTNFGAQTLHISSTADGSSTSSLGRGLLLVTNAGTQTVGAFSIVGVNNNTTSVSVWTNYLRHTFNPSSGGAILNSEWIQPTINQTGGASGTTRGLFVDPVLTSAFDWRSIEWSNNTGWGLYGSGTANNYLAGNLSVGTTGTTARLVVRGTGTTSSSVSLSVQNSDGNALFRVFDNGVVNFGTQLNRGFWVNNDGSNTPVLDGTSLRFSHSVSSQNQAGFVFRGANVLNATSGTQSNILFNQPFSPASGTASFNQVLIDNTINQTGGASGTTRGLYVNPTLTSAFDWRSIEWSNSSGWGLYGAGTANNYLGGNLSVGTTGTTARLVVVGSQPSGTTTWTAQFHNALGNSNSLMIRDDGNVGIGTNTPQSLLQIGTGSSVGSISTPALRIGTNANGFYTDNNRLFVVANGNFGGGFDSSGFIGNSVYVNTTSGVNSLNTPKLGGYRLTAQGLTSGLAGNSVGDLALTTNNIPRLTITFSGNTGIGTITPNVSSILELSSTTQGFLSPRMTTAQRDAIVSPATGLELFNTSIGSKQVYNGTEWEILNGARQAITASSSTTSIVFRNGNIADIVLSSSTTLSFSNAAVGTYIVKITQGGSGFNLVSWPANVLWSGGIIPTLTTAVGKTDIFTFVFDSTNYYGSYALNY